jgi:hypothetical protein
MGPHWRLTRPIPDAAVCSHGDAWPSWTNMDNIVMLLSICARAFILLALSFRCTCFPLFARATLQSSHDLTHAILPSQPAAALSSRLFRHHHPASPRRLVRFRKRHRPHIRQRSDRLRYRLRPRMTRMRGTLSTRPCMSPVKRTRARCEMHRWEVPHTLAFHVVNSALMIITPLWIQPGYNFLGPSADRFT